MSETKTTEKKATIDPVEARKKYDRFCELHHLMYNGNTRKYEKKNLKPNALAEYEVLEKEIKAWTGKKPKKTATVYARHLAITVKLVEGYAIPATLEADLKGSKILDLYF